MKFLYIMGASGSGKTTLAKRLEKLNPEKYNRVVQYTTREPREGEIEGQDYNFITDLEYDFLESTFFERVKQQYAPTKYGGSIHDTDPDKWNICVMCLEGTLSGIHDAFDDEIVILNILCDGKGFVSRDGRDGNSEERFNKAALYPFLSEDFEEPNRLNIEENNMLDVFYYELDIEDLKNMSDSEVLSYMDKLCS